MAAERAERALRRARPVRAAITLARLRHGAARAEWVHERQALAEALPSVHRAFGDAAASEAAAAPRTVLVPGWSAVRHILQQAPVLAGFVTAGYEPVVLLYDRRRVPHRLYRALGVRRFVWFDRYDRREDPGLGARLLAATPDRDALLELEHGGVRVGRYASATLLRQTRRSTLDLDPATRPAVGRALQQVLDHAHALRRILGEVRPDAVLLVDRGYTPEGPLFDLALADGVEAITWNMAHRDNTLLLRRYDAATRDEHPAALSTRTWTDLRALPWDEARWAETHAELRSSYESGEWFAEVGTQFGSRLLDGAAVRAQLELDDRPVAAIFPHIFWDATYFWGTDLFADYREWFVEAVRTAYANTKVQWLIKVHPANIVKNARDGVDDEPGEQAVLRELGPVPEHIRVLPADTTIATLSLFDVIEFCCTVRGTVGIEAAALGVTVITAGTGRYDHLGFTVDPDSPDELRATLAALPDIAFEPDLEAARRYAHGVLLARPLRLRSFSARFRKDAAATLDVALPDLPWHELRRQPDVAALAAWLGSDRPDFVDPALLGG